MNISNLTNPMQNHANINTVPATTMSGNKSIPRLASREIVVDREPSHVKPCDFEVIVRALARVKSNGRQFIEEEVQFPGEIGSTTCVETGGGDDIVFAQRKNRRPSQRMS